MKRLLTATCFAMACAVGLAAQQTTGTTGTSEDQSGQGRGPRTVTGCLRAGDTAGTYTLTDIQMGNAATTGTTATGGTTTTGGGTTTAGGAGTTAASGQRGQMPTSLTLTTTDSSVDLKPHVGHKIEVTGTMAGGGRGGDTTGATTTGGGTTTTGGGTTTTGGGATTTGAAGQTTGGQGRGGMRTMNVTSVRMISESCTNQ
jgi:hypothetical protein